MLWESLTGATFEDAVRLAQGVCLLPVGVIEYHGPHLPLGTDMINVQSLARIAAEREPAVVFPQYFGGANVETKHYPGGIVLRQEVMFAPLDNVCQEISRNGLKKIVLLNGHGGNRYFLPLFVQMALDQGRDYVPYYVDYVQPEADVYNRTVETTEHGHACECETSVTLHCHGEWVRMDLLDPEKKWINQHLLSLDGVYTPADWYSQTPEQCAGDPRPASAEKGRVLFESQVDRLVKLLVAIRADSVAAAIYAEFNSRIYRR